MPIDFDNWRRTFSEAREEVHKGFIGYDDLITCIFLCLIGVGLNSTAHMLIIGKTGTGKSRLSKRIAPLFGLESHRINATSEALPSDILGYEDLKIWRERPGEDEDDEAIVKGPIFTNYLHVDEGNRWSPRTRDGLLAPMAERSVTIGRTEFILDPPFIVVWTENPASYRDVLPLAPQERDRFAYSYFSGWPDFEEQIKITEVNTQPPSAEAELKPLRSKEDLLALQEEVPKAIHIDLPVRRYAVHLTRQLAPELSEIPEISGKNIIEDTSIVRGANDLLVGARAYALLEGFDYVRPSDVDWVANFALPHRMNSFSNDFHRRRRRDFIGKARSVARRKMTEER